MSPTDLVTTEYRRMPAARGLRKAQIAVVGSVIADIVHTTGAVTAKDYVDACRAPESRGHSTLEWDNSVAGELYRLVQASYYLRHVAVEVVIHEGTAEEQSIPVRALHRVDLVTTAGEHVPDYRYVPLEEVLDHETYLRQVIAEAKRAMESFERRFRLYASFPEFRDAVTPIWERVMDPDAPSANGQRHD